MRKLKRGKTIVPVFFLSNVWWSIITSDSMFNRVGIMEVVFSISISMHKNLLLNSREWIFTIKFRYSFELAEILETNFIPFDDGAKIVLTQFTNQSFQFFYVHKLDYSNNRIEVLTVEALANGVTSVVTFVSGCPNKMNKKKHNIFSRIVLIPNACETNTFLLFVIRKQKRLSYGQRSVQSALSVFFFFRCRVCSWVIKIW